MNIALRAFWSNQPMPIQEKIKQPDLILNLPFGDVLTLTTGVRSINNKTGDVALNTIDVGADLVGSARHVFDELSPKVDALIDNKLALYTTNFTEPLSYQDSAFLKLPKFP